MTTSTPTAAPAPLIPMVSALPDVLRSIWERGTWGPELETQTLALKLLNVRSPTDMYDTEREIHAVFRDMADQLVEDVLRYLVEDPRLVEPCRGYWTNVASAQGEKLQSNGYKKTPIALLGGRTITVRTLRLARVAPKRPGPKRGRGKRGSGGTGIYPALAQLGITGQATPALRAEVAREVAEAHSVSVARESLSQRGLTLHHGVTLRLAYSMANSALDARTRRFEGRDSMMPPKPDKDLFRGKRLLISMDGGRLKVRENPKGGRRRESTGHQRYDGVWKEPKVLTIVILNKEGRRDPAYPPLLDATMGDADAATELLIGHLRAHGGEDAAEVSLVADGAAWIWNRGSTIREQVGIPKERWHEVLDFYHAVEHLAEVSKLVRPWKEKERAAWLKLQKRRLKNGHTQRVLEAVQVLRVGRRSKKIRIQLSYFETHKDRLDYKKCREKGRPMGSGAIESGVRRIVNLRMKGNSIFWLEDHAEGILHLRSLLKSGRWDAGIRDAISVPIWSLAL